MKLWVDDLRTPPDDTWRWAKTSKVADSMLRRWKMNGVQVDVVSLDHDLGGDDTTRPLVLWMCETGFWPVEVRVHSANPVGRDWLLGMIERYKQ
jgi:hypothetical protein